MRVVKVGPGTYGMLALAFGSLTFTLGLGILMYAVKNILNHL